MTAFNRYLHIVGYSSLALIMIFGFQNCSNGSSRFLINKKDTANQFKSDGELGKSNPVEFCAMIQTQEIKFKLNYDDPLVLDIPFSSSCAGLVRVTRSFLSENNSSLTVRLPNADVAFVGTVFQLEPGTFEDHLLISHVKNYGETRLELNYHLTYQDRTILIPVTVLIQIEFPLGSKVISAEKITCAPERALRESFQEAYQIKYKADHPLYGQWSPCIITKCAEEYYFSDSGFCEPLVVANNCQLEGEYSWGSATAPSCRGHSNGTLVVGQSVFVNNTASGYRGQLKLFCEIVESEKKVSQELGVYKNVKVREPSIRPDYSIGGDSKVVSSCNQTESKSCVAFAETGSYEYEEYLFNVPSISHGDNIFVKGVSTKDSSQVKKRLYACMDGHIQQRLVSDDYKLPGINVSVKNYYLETGEVVLTISLWRAEHLNHCNIEVTTIKGVVQKTSTSVGPDTFTYNLPFENITSDDGEVYIHCAGEHSARVFNIPYFGLKREK